MRGLFKDRVPFLKPHGTISIKLKVSEGFRRKARPTMQPSVAWIVNQPLKRGTVSSLECVSPLGLP